MIEIKDRSSQIISRLEPKQPSKTHCGRGGPGEREHSGPSGELDGMGWGRGERGEKGVLCNSLQSAHSQIIGFGVSPLAPCRVAHIW